MKNTNKKIVIFNEMSDFFGKNIMNNTIWSRDLNKFVKFNGYKLEEAVQGGEGSAWGKYWQYMPHAFESKILFKIIKFIRKNKNRITIIGVDRNDGNLDRDYFMYKNIMRHYTKTNINFFWAHNDHVSDQQYSMDNLQWIKNKNHKWYCGYYLKKKIKDDYCIILSQAYRGENRFNSYCSGENCEERKWQLEYFYKKFKYNKLKNYFNPNKKYQLLTKFNGKLINFSNSYYRGNRYGMSSYDDNNNWNYILFWNKVNRLEPLVNY